MTAKSHNSVGFGERLNNHLEFRLQFFALLGLASYSKAMFPLGLSYSNFHAMIVPENFCLTPCGVIVVVHRFLIIHVKAVSATDLVSLFWD